MSHISRRTWLKGLALFSVAAGNAFMLLSTAAEAKASKAAVHYRDYPKGMHVQVLHRIGRQERWHVYGHDGSRSLPSSAGQD
jgi:hypothetical protein